MTARYLIAGLILAVSLTAPARAQQSSDPIVEISVTPAEVAVGEPVTLRVSVFVPTWFPQPPTFPSFEIPNAITRLPPNSSRPGSKRVGNDSWSGITRNYQVYPLLGARFRLESQTIELTYANPGHESVKASVATGDIEFNAVVPPGAENLVPYVAGTRLALTRDIEGDTDALEVGDAIVVTYAAELEGLAAIFLPEIIGAVDTPGVSVYPEQAVVEDGAVARRSEKLTFIFNAGGDFEIPAAKIDWWNNSSSQVETAALPALSLTVVGPPLQAAGENARGEDRNWWTVAAALIAVALVLKWLTSRASIIRERHDERVRLRQASESYAWDKVRSAMSGNDARRVHDEIIRWLGRIERGLDTRSFVERFGNAELSAELETLSRSLYAESGETADFDMIARNLSKARKRYLHEYEHRLEVSLPAMNP